MLHRPLLGLLQRYRRLIYLVVALVTAFIIYDKFRISIYERQAARNILGVWKQDTVSETDPPGLYDWKTTSAFNPANIPDAANKTIDELCESFPSSRLDQIQPILKTGNALLKWRLKAQLEGPSACLHNLLIFSDLEEEVEGHHLIDVIQDIPKHLSDASSQLQPWRDLNSAAANGTLDKEYWNSQGWATDKFKFLAGISRAWEMRPERSWYVFYEGDTYIFWDGLFRLLEQFNPDEPFYFGSPTSGRLNTFFANGGAGFVLSRGAMRILTANDHDKDTDAYLGSQLSAEEWWWIQEDCCGDSTLGWTLARRGVFVSGFYPSFSLYSPHSFDFRAGQLCQPIISLHQPHTQEFETLFHWEWTQRTTDHAVSFRDLAFDYHNFSSPGFNIEEIRADWDVGDDDSFPPPQHPNKFFVHDPHVSAAACADACKMHDECFQWRFHFRECLFASVFRLGEERRPMEPSEEERGRLAKTLGLSSAIFGFGRKQHHRGDDDGVTWDSEDERFFSGWNGELIRRFAQQHTCPAAAWVRPSVKRIYDGR